MTEASAPTTALPAGWYPDQLAAGYYRWWDGQTWTEHRQRVQFDPPTTHPVAPAPSPVARTTPPAPSAMIPPPPPPAEWRGPTPTGPLRQQQHGNALAVWSLALGILGILCLLIPYAGLAVGIVALVLGIVGHRAARTRQRGRGVAIAGIATGGVATLVGALLAVTFTMYLASSESRSAVSDPDAAAEVPAVEATPSNEPSDGAAQGEPASQDSATTTNPASFVLRSGNDLDDIDKDLDDMIVTLDQAGFWRLLSNSIELTFNYTQLAQRAAPAEITEAWNAQLAAFEAKITEMDAAITEERNGDLRTLIDDARVQVQSLRDLLATVEQ